MHINDTFFALKETNICNFADDTTPYFCFLLSLKIVLEKLRHNSKLATALFQTNYMKLDTDRCQLLITGRKHEHIWAKIEKRYTLGRVLLNLNSSSVHLCRCFFGRQTNNNINKLHEGTLRILYNDTATSFEDLLIKDRSFTIHRQNIQSSGNKYE